MRVFLDTEFTDFHNPRLISVGLAAENGQTFYGELADGWTTAHCTEFVIDTVLPLLERDRLSPLNRDEAGARIAAWLASFGPRVRLIFDTETDWRLITTLLWPYRSAAVDIVGELLSWPFVAMAQRQEELLEALLETHPRRHHALVDAESLCQSVLQTEAEFLDRPDTAPETARALSAVPFRERGRISYVRLNDIPPLWRARFEQALFGAQMPYFNDDEGICAYAWDWRHFLNRIVS